MSHWIGTTSPTDAGMTDFKECLKYLRDGQAEQALQHARRALGVAPKNPFYLSYTGLLAAVSEKRFGDAESLCREALGMRVNHAQLYLNLAEVYHQAELPPDDNDLFWLDSALNRDILTPEQRQHLIDNHQRS